MANTKSAIKAVRQSNTRKKHNLFWKKKIAEARKVLRKALESQAANDILKTYESTLQKVLDRAVKNKAIHKNKANRIKTRMATKITAHAKPKPTKHTKIGGNHRPNTQIA